jgi:hypothetical protein
MRRSGWVRAARAAAALLPATLIVTAGGAGSASANPDASVVTIGGDRHDSMVRATVEYDVELDSSRVVREVVGDPDLDPLSGVPVHQDLDASRTRHTVTPRLELAFGPGLWVSAALPIVLADDRDLKLHDGVGRDGSSTLRDGLLPRDGFDAQNGGAAFGAGDDLVFRGQRRSGLDQVYAGLGAAVMNQRRDSTKPTWKLGAEGRFAVGKVARFDAMAPGANVAVGRGVHELRLWTTVAKRVSFVETYFGIAWQVPIVVKDASLFRDLGYGSTNVNPSQQGELRLGLEGAVLDRPEDDLRVGIDLGSRLTARFEGRDYSELWEVFALAGDARTADAPLVLDSDPVTAGVQARSHPGVTNVENHLELGGNLAVRAQLGKNFQLALIGELVWKTDHTITFADAGIDLPTCSAGQTSGCELANNDLIDDGTEEENPAFVSRVDLVGHRYRSVDGLGVIFGVQASGSF